MDTLYIGNIPSEYHYALFGNGYIDLFNTNVLHNNVYNYYRVFTNSGGFFYEYRSTSVSQYTTTYTQNINVTDNVCYRFDFVNVLTVTLIIAVFGIWLFNLITSIIRKGGLLGGLL